jgi:acetylornithine deacetylase/succinyl-diaminopimelate desuccinylase-like protein
MVYILKLSELIFFMKKLCGKLLFSASFFALATSSVLAETLASAPMPPVANQKLAHDIFKQLIEIRSVHDSGTKTVAEALADRFKAAGFAAADIHLVPEAKHPQQVNLIVRLRGHGKDKPVLWVGHLDVVEAKPEDWSEPPFKFIEKDNYFYGRGTSDTKGEDAAVAAALIRLKQEAYVPDRDIIAAFTADEEVGLEQDGVDYLLKHHPDLVDAGLVINPDGGTGEYAEGKRLDFGIETSQKIYITYELEVTNKGGHSSEPRPDNAIYILANGLEKLSHYEFPFSLNATTRLYFQRMADNATGQVRADMLAVAQDKPDLAAASRLALKVAYNAILHTTCVPTMLAAGHQENALPQRATATVQCRVMPDETEAQTQRAIENAISNSEIKVKRIGDVMQAPESRPTPALLLSVEKVAHSMWPGVIVAPMMIAGASDSLFTRHAGIPTYGIGGSWNDINDIRWHGKNERLDVNVFYSDVEFTYRLMKELSAS